MKFTRVVLLCNLCWDETGGDVETPADHTLIFKTSDDTDDFFRLDICENHASNGTTLGEMIAAAEAIDPTTPVTHKAVGRSRKAAALDMTEPAHLCPECLNSYASKGGVSLHMKAKHPEAWAQIVLERDAEAERQNVLALNNGK